MELVRAGRLDYIEKTKTFRPHAGNIGQFRQIFSRYSHTISDPELVAHIAWIAGASVVEVDAGQGYWSYLLGQVGVKCHAYERGFVLGPRAAWGTVSMSKLDTHRRVLASHEDDTLVILNTLHPYDSVMKALGRYQGRRVVLSLCDAPEYPRLAEILDRDWVEVYRFKGANRVVEPRTVFTFDRKGWNNAPTKLYSIIR